MLQGTHQFAGGGHQLERTLFVGQQDSGRVHGQQLDAPFGQHVQELDAVEPLHERVRQLYEGLCHSLVRHSCP